MYKRLCDLGLSVGDVVTVSGGGYPKYTVEELGGRDCLSFILSGRKVRAVAAWEGRSIWEVAKALTEEDVL